MKLFRLAVFSCAVAGGADVFTVDASAHAPADRTFTFLLEFFLFFLDFFGIGLGHGAILFGRLPSLLHVVLDGRINPVVDDP